MLFVTADGCILPCPLLRDEAFRLRNILDCDIERIWLDHPTLKAIRTSVCNPDCLHLSKCRGDCKSRAYFANRDFNAVDPVTCALFPR